MHPRKRKAGSRTGPDVLPQLTDQQPTKLRIVGGSCRGRALEYSGDLRTRPMKDRVREAVFNLVGPIIKGSLAIDLFAGTGALGIEALSRGALEAYFVERHFPTADLIRRNLKQLDLEGGEVVAADTFWWVPRAELPRDKVWVIFVSPPYELYQTHDEEMLTLIRHYVARAPEDSCLVVECDERFDLTRLPVPEQWDTRTYTPAVIAIHRVSAAASPVAP